MWSAILRRLSKVADKFAAQVCREQLAAGGVAADRDASFGASQNKGSANSCVVGEVRQRCAGFAGRKAHSFSPDGIFHTGNDCLSKKHHSSLPKRHLPEERVLEFLRFG